MDIIPINSVLCRVVSVKKEENGEFGVIVVRRGTWVYRFLTGAPPEVSWDIRLSGSADSSQKDIYKNVLFKAGVAPKQAAAYRYAFVNDATWSVAPTSPFSLSGILPLRRLV